MGLAERVRRLIDGYFGGERNAARVTGVARMTLRRLAAGEIPDPRHSVLKKLSKATGADIEWFVSGEGKGPDRTDPTGVRLPSVERWKAFVNDLDLPPESRNAMLTLPRSTAIAFLSLIATGMTEDTTPPTEVYVLAQENEVRAWEAFFKGLIAHYGRDAVRQKLAAEPEILGRQFNPAMNRLWTWMSTSFPDQRKHWEEAMWGPEETRATDRDWGDTLPFDGRFNAMPLIERKR